MPSNDSTSRRTARRRAKLSAEKRIASLVVREVAKVIPQIVAQVHSLSNSRTPEDSKTKCCNLLSFTNTSKPVTRWSSRVKEVCPNYSSGSILSKLPFVRVGVPIVSVLLAQLEYFNHEHSTGGQPNVTNVGSPRLMPSLGMS